MLRERKQATWYFLARKSVEIDVDSMVYYCCLSVASFVVFVCVSVCGTHCQPTVLCQYGARFILERQLS